MSQTATQSARPAAVPVAAVLDGVDGMEGADAEARRDAREQLVRERAREVMPSYVRAGIVGIFVLLLIGSLYFAADLLIPITVAVVLALTLSPVVRKAERFGIPAALSSVLVTLSLAAVVALTVLFLVDPLTELIDDAPRYRAQLEDKIKTLRAPVDAMVEAGEQVEAAAGSGSDGERPSVVTVEGPSIVATAANRVVTGVTSFVVVFVLLIFLLAASEKFYEKLVGAFDKFRDKKRALRMVFDIEREVSRYLLTITVINAGLGVVVGTVLTLLGMPAGYLWGVIAFAANFIPYIGSLMGIVASAVVALVTFPTVGGALLVPGAYFVCTFLEGQFITPILVGRRLRLNAAVIFVAVAFWAWLWGLVGAFLAVPLLVIFKTFCTNYEPLNTVADFLGAGAPVEDEDGDKTNESPARS